MQSSARGSYESRSGHLIALGKDGQEFVLSHLQKQALGALWAQNGLNMVSKTKKAELYY